jgi:acetyltransferase-like isoleucine patch superfamily enzyme
MLKKLFWSLEDCSWNFKCRYGFWLHGPYGLARVIEKMPFRYIVKYLRRYGATVADTTRIERGMIIQRPDPVKPFKNLVLKDGSFVGYKAIMDLSEPIVFEEYAGIGGFCQVWTHQTTSLIPPCPENRGSVILRRNSICYSGVIVSPGVTIGENARVGACSLVNKDVPPDTFVGGVPAKPISTGKS